MYQRIQGSSHSAKDQPLANFDSGDYPRGINYVSAEDEEAQQVGQNRPSPRFARRTEGSSTD